jgi:cysteine-rich repeat protein
MRGRCSPIDAVSLAGGLATISAVGCGGLLGVDEWSAAGGGGTGGAASATGAQGSGGDPGDASGGAPAGGGGATGTGGASQGSGGVGGKAAGAGGAGGSAPKCGDGNLDPDEECDDADDDDLDGCTSACAIDCSGVGAGWYAESPTGRCYWIGTDKVDWVTAEAECVEWNGHLASIQSSGEQSFVVGGALAVAAYDPWIGLSDGFAEGTYAWTNMEPYDFSAWAAGQPNESEIEDCVLLVFATAWLWHDADCAAQRAFACERAPGL